MNLLQKIKNRNPFLNVYKRADLWRMELGYVGDSVQVFHKVSFGSEPYLIEIGSMTKITYGCKFITHDGGVYVLRNINKDANGASVYGKIVVGRNCFLGNDVTVLPGVRIGDNCIVGAGAVVTKSIPDNSVAAGVPCRVISTIEEYYNNMKSSFIFTEKMTACEKKEMLLQLYNSQSHKFICK